MFLNVVENSDLSTIQYINISGGRNDGNLVFETLSKNKTLISLIEINIRNREWTPEFIDKFLDILSFDGPLIREDSQSHQGNDVAIIKIVHDNPTFKGTLNKMSSSTHKIIYGFKNAFKDKWKYHGDLVYVLLREKYKEQRR